MPKAFSIQHLPFQAASDGFVDRTTGKYDVTENRMGFVAVMNDRTKNARVGRVGPSTSGVLIAVCGLVLAFAACEIFVR